jgi:hypothetical protein
LHELSTTFILGYHGCDRSVAEALIAGADFRFEANEWDWLGSGVYFWEANPLRGLEYAYELKANPGRTRGSVQEPAVVGAVIDLGLCLDLTSSTGIRSLKASHDSFVRLCESEGRAIPVNKGGPDYLMRNLDCAVINNLHAVMAARGLPPFDTVRGVFQEGNPIYRDAGFREKTHIQICVRNAECIKGVFRVAERYLKDFVPPCTSP